MKKTYKIEVDCANCANLVEDAAKKVEGVKELTISFMTQKMKVSFEEGADHEVVAVECLTLIKQHGSLHCATMQLPFDLD